MNLLTIVFLNDQDLEFVPRSNEPSWHETEFNVVKANSSDELLNILSKQGVSLIVSADKSEDISRTKWFKLYQILPNYFKGLWFNIPDLTKYDSQTLADELLNFYGRVIASPRSEFFSIITPVYHTKPHVFERLYDSIKAQTFPHWEWIIIDDSKDKSKTEYIKGLVEDDFRVSYHNLEHSGNIGQVKKKGFMLSEGSWLMEVDHDDILLPSALMNTHRAFQDPEIGFVYSDCIEANINSYGEIVSTRNYSVVDGKPTDGNWGISGTGKHYYFNYEGQELLAARSPNQNSQSIRHITSMPNHLRCWRADIYKKLGGHSPLVHVADDFELLIRTFLETKFGHLNSVEYIQFYEIESENTNTQYSRNAEIQRMVYWIAKSYDQKINERFKELGVDDYSFKDGYSHWWEDFKDLGSKQFANVEF